MSLDSARWVQARGQEINWLQRLEVKLLWPLFGQPLLGSQNGRPLLFMHGVLQSQVAGDHLRKARGR